jgi:cytochrome c
MSAQNLYFKENTMKSNLPLAFVLAAVLGVSMQAHASADLAKSKNCLGCHAIDRKVLGPSFKDVAQKYASVKGADAKLASKIAEGGSGVWGNIAMPPNAVSAQEAQILAKWVLAQK